MSESILMPIFIGFAISVIIFSIALFVFKTSRIKAVHITFMCTLLVIVMSFAIGSWLGMGIGVISGGMFLTTMGLYILFAH